MTAPLLIVLVLLLAGGAALLGLVGALYLFARTGMVVSWRGRQIQLVSGQLHRELRVDDRLVTWRVVGTAPWVRLDGILADAALGPVPMVWVGQRRGTPYALYVGGKRIAGTWDDPEAQAASAIPEPTDTRWPAARAILESLGQSGDPSVQAATLQIGQGLRDALRHLRTLAETADAHAALGGDAELTTARTALDAEVERWIAVLRALHLQSTVNAGSADDLLARVRAESEVDRAVRAKARALAARLEG